ncbi:hypothetical protein K438DRAFT_1823034 [Mycena galopus ATCC 62051]|nr:hypothetical protein K438DRAFT_1823034 [Mycena galopus ATCC 62051]
MLECLVWSPTPSFTADQELRQHHIHFNDHLIHQQAEERDLCQRCSSPDLRRRPPQDRFQPPQAHQPIPILYSPYIPIEYESLEDEVADHMNKFREFKRVINTTVVLWATVGRNREAFLPEFVWRSYEEDGVYELRVPASHVFELGDVVRCHGLVTGNWRMASPVDRYSRRSKKQWHGLQDWVCIVCQNPLLQQEVLVKIPAEYFYPPPSSSSQASTFHRTLHKFKSMLNLSRIPEEPMGQ